MELDLKVTNVFQRNYNALLDEHIRFIINIGGTRSSKSYSLCQLMILYCLQNPNKIVSVVRKSFPALRATIMRDMINIIKDLDLYSEKNHNKTENIYTFDNGSIIEFFSVDDEQKIRGRKRDILFANEANELSFEEFNQLNFRTSSKLLFDFNPSDMYHWLYDLLLKGETIKIHSTYKDNPFLEESLIKQIEDLINVDYEYYKIYCLGEQAMAKSSIYTHQQSFDEYPEDITDFVYGLDFGYTHPTALVKVSHIENKLFWEEIIFQSHLISTDLIRMMNDLSIEKYKATLCDGARPEIIEELKRAGYYAMAANKSVKEGIDYIKSKQLFIKSNSINIWKEIKQYKWKTNGDIILDEPVKMYDDGLDAARYSSLHLKRDTTTGLSMSFTTF